MRFLFLLAHGRSGSTAVQKVLNTLPGYCIRGEAGGLARHLALAQHTAHMLPARFAKAQPPDAPWFGAGDVDPQGFARDLTEAFTRNILRPPEGTRVAGFKEIRFLPKVEVRIGGEPYEAEDGIDDAAFERLIETLLNGFGEARIILLSRSPAVTAGSGWYQAFDRDQVIQRLTACAARFDATAARDSDRIFRLHHEDFDKDPEGLRPLLDWLAEPMAPEALAQALAERLTHASDIPKRHQNVGKNTPTG